MARIRSVHPDICQSEAMAGVTPSGERTFVRLWTHCDDDGRCLNNPKLIRAALYPLHDQMTAGKVEGDLDELEGAGLIVRYEVDGKAFLAVKSWDEYQHPQRPRPSKYPSPLDASVTPRVHVAEVSRTGGGVERERERERETGEGVGVARRSPSLAESFTVWYGDYPRKVGRRNAEKAYLSAVKRGADPQDILDGLHRTLPNFVKAEAKFIPHPATWLNQDRWLDGNEFELEHERREAARRLARHNLGYQGSPFEDETVIELEAGE